MGPSPIDDSLDLRAPRETAPPVRLVVVDEEPVTRSALARLARHPGVDVVGKAATVTEAVEVAARSRPDVVVSSLFLPDGDAFELTLRLKHGEHTPEVVVVTRFATPAAAGACSAAGVRRCLRGDAPLESIAAACVAAARGDAWVGPGVVETRAGDRLTDLEAQVLAEVASGSTNEVTAERLGYSPNYIKDVLASARERLGARDRAHAAAMAVTLRLVRPGDDGRFTPAAGDRNTSRIGRHGPPGTG